MRTSACTALFLIGTLLQAQTCFYVHTIGQVPVAPDDQTPVSLVISGDLSSSGAYIVSAWASVAGGQVTVEISCTDPGGLAVLVPHDVTIPLGLLDPGIYSIVFNSPGTADLAPPSQHQFEVLGGTGLCDSLAILHVGWHPFNDQGLLVTLLNSGSGSFPDPWMVLHTGNGDTLGVETVSWPGLNGTTDHILNIPIGITPPSGLFNATLELWTDSAAQPTCSWELDLSLCPEDSCTMLYPRIGNFGGALVDATYHWVLIDQQTDTAGTGSMDLSGMIQEGLDSICVAPGTYSLHMWSDPPFTGGQLQYGVGTGENSAGPGLDATFAQGTDPNVMNVPFYQPCSGSTNDVNGNAPRSSLRWGRLGAGFWIEDQSGSPLGAVVVCDASGRSIVDRLGRDSLIRIDLEGVPAGMLIISLPERPGVVVRIPWTGS
ncbi:MAG: hypothetical protein KDB88_06710 [Flavobacteriales bacterium]|nr:hypothetical protein [Flavobacteriales bacterium]